MFVVCLLSLASSRLVKFVEDRREGFANTCSGFTVGLGFSGVRFRVQILGYSVSRQLKVQGFEFRIKAVELRVWAVSSPGFGF